MTQVVWETPVLIVARAAPKKSACAFTQVLAKTDPLSDGLGACVRSEGQGQLFSASGFVVAAASACEY